jgi:Predicted glycosyl hydrolase
MKNYLYLFLLIGLIYPTAVFSKNEVFIKRAQQTLDSLYKYYGVSHTYLLSENYPVQKLNNITYLASQTQSNNSFSYLWPFSGTFSAVNSLYFATNDKRYISLLNNSVLKGLDNYLDKTRKPTAYASYIRKAGKSDRFYDDNVWIGIDFTDIYSKTKNKKYLSKAKMIWNFIESGIDNKLDGGVYWCEQKKNSKNTCSNAPASVFALKLFLATSDSSYFAKGKELYEWTKAHLRDQSDDLYYDNISLNRHIDKAKYPYNSGQMLQAAALLYRITNNSCYLYDAQKIAKSCSTYFFLHKDNCEIVLKEENIWFSTVMLRGFIELYNVDHQSQYLETFRQILDTAWNKARDTNGLLNRDCTGKIKDKTKWLLTQAAYIEMYARLGTLQ